MGDHPSLLPGWRRRPVPSLRRIPTRPSRLRTGDWTGGVERDLIGKLLTMRVLLLRKCGSRCLYVLLKRSDVCSWRRREGNAGIWTARRHPPGGGKWALLSRMLGPRLGIAVGLLWWKRAGGLRLRRRERSRGRRRGRRRLRVVSLIHGLRQHGLLQSARWWCSGRPGYGQQRRRRGGGCDWLLLGCVWGVVVGVGSGRRWSILRRRSSSDLCCNRSSRQARSLGLVFL
mmetsp:Transcript_68097/g.181944  ORF Transcript_68097/g.181944 Transcript_68097/m.181944 type:complete len:229 (-) Transcript_68097:287-973(-)